MLFCQPQKIIKILLAYFRWMIYIEYVSDTKLKNEVRKMNTIKLERKLNSTQDAINLAKPECKKSNLCGVIVPNGAVLIECNIGSLIVSLFQTGASGCFRRKASFASRFELNGEAIKRAELEKVIQSAK